jgi:GntR family transcriptional regulator
VSPIEEHASPSGDKEDRSGYCAVALPLVSLGLLDQRLSLTRSCDQRLATRVGIDVVIHYHGAIMDGTISLVKVDPLEPVELHQQVAAEIRRSIIDGECGPGDRLPPAVDLAAVLGVSRNTVLRALRELRDEGVLEFRRGRGVHVTGTGVQRSVVIDQAKKLIAVARRQGMSRDELAQLITSLG